MNGPRRCVALMASACLLHFSLPRELAADDPQPSTPIVLHYKEVPIFLGPHEHWVNAVAFSHDGRAIATGSGDGYLRLWDATTGRLKSILGEDRARGLQGVAFSPDDRFVAVVGTVLGKDIVIWDTTTGRIAHEFDPPTDVVNLAANSPDAMTMIYKGKPIAFRKLNTVAYSPDGQLLATAGDEVVLRESQSGNIVATLEHPVKGIKALAFSADSTTLATASCDMKIRLWSVPAGELAMTLSGPVLEPSAVAISPDGQRIVATSSGFYLPGDTPTLIAGGHLWQWDRSTGEARKTQLGLRSGSAVAFISPSKVVVGAGKDLLLVDLESKDESAEPPKLWSHSEEVFAVAVSPDGSKVVSGSHDRTADVVDIAKEKLLYRLPGLNDILTSLTTSSDGKYFVTATRDGRLSTRIFGDSSTFAARYEQHFSGDSTNAGRFQPSEVRIWSTPDGVLQSTLPLDPCLVTAVACIPKSDLVAVAGWIPGTGGMLSLWDVKNLQKIRDFEIAGSEVLTIGASPDGQTLAGGDAEGNFVLWNIQSGAKQLSIKHEYHVEAVTFSAKGQIVAVGDSDRVVRLYDAWHGTLLQTRSCVSYIRSLAFSPDETLLAVGTQSSGMELLNVRTGAPRRLLLAPGDSFAVVAGFVAFSPDGRFIVGVGHGKNIAVFDADTGNLHCELEGHYHAPTAVVFLPDGRLVSGGEERTIRLWDIEKDERLATWVVMPSDQRQQWNDEWIGYTPARQYVSSTDQQRLMGWEIGGELFTKDDPGSPQRAHSLFGE